MLDFPPEVTLLLGTVWMKLWLALEIPELFSFEDEQFDVKKERSNKRNAKSIILSATAIVNMVSLWTIHRNGWYFPETIPSLFRTSAQFLVFFYCVLITGRCSARAPPPNSLGGEERRPDSGKRRKLSLPFLLFPLFLSLPPFPLLPPFLQFLPFLLFILLL